MPVPVRCNHCRQMMKVADDAIGTTGGCRGRKSFLTLPPFDEASAADTEVRSTHHPLRDEWEPRAAKVAEVAEPIVGEPIEPTKRQWLEPSGVLALVSCGI